VYTIEYLVESLETFFDKKSSLDSRDIAIFQKSFDRKTSRDSRDIAIFQNSF